MLAVEYAEPIKETCSCCGGLATRLTRFVYRDNDAFAVYYAAYTEKPHNTQCVLAAVSLGSWHEEEIPEDRVVFTVEIRSTPNQFEVEVLNADRSLWQDAEILGHQLDREDALAHPWLKDVFDITDQMVRDDLEIKSYFEDGEIP